MKDTDEGYFFEVNEQCSFCRKLHPSKKKLFCIKKKIIQQNFLEKMCST